MSAVAPEMQERLLSTRAELQAVRARIAALRRSKQTMVLSQSQVGVETDNRVWQGVGKMFKSISVDDFNNNVNDRTKQIDDQIEALAKKETYYATTLDKLLLAITGK
ncbi:hypothetical protein DASB73_038290 [Starmerella bacillaris]|uniref:Prefoldin subunit 1 n=1 Tax=Starmerella bacillaris TaxID=1247836 RepID=A0AAV5RP14_STABA|nr:hypothetical protein DASB73_038290 [Starmerella bacillaris]